MLARGRTLFVRSGPILLASALALLAPGCGYSLRLGVGPAVDTAGRAGFEVRLSGTIGPGDEDGALVAGPYLGVGLMEGEDATLSYGGMLGGTVIASDHFSGNAALLIGGRTALGAIERQYGDLGLELGVGYALFDEREHHRGIPFLIPSNTTRGALILGLQLRAEYLWGTDERGTFSAPVYVEWYGGS